MTPSGLVLYDEGWAQRESRVRRNRNEVGAESDGTPMSFSANDAAVCAKPSPRDVPVMFRAQLIRRRRMWQLP